MVREEYAKLQMRRELYAHVSAAYEQELVRTENDEQVALKQTLLRMGDPQQLTRELQDSVGTLDRWTGHIDAIMFRPVGMSLWRYALRATLYFGGPFVGLLCLMLLLRSPELLTRQSSAAAELRFISSMGFVWIMNEFFCIAIFGKACEIYLQDEWTFVRVVTAILLASVAAVEVLLADWLFTVLTTGSADLSHLLPFWVLLAIVMGLAMIIVPWLTEVQLRGLKEWRELEIDG